MQADASSAVPAPLENASRELAKVARLVVGSAPVVALFVLLERALMDFSHLRAGDYEGPGIALALVRKLAGGKGMLAALGAVAWLATWRKRLFWRSWSEFDHGNALRLAIGGLTLVFAWTFATYETNLFFERTHGFDRALLIALAALVFWRPAFLLLFLPLLLGVVWQFEYPLGGYSWTDKSAPLRVLLLFQAAFLWLSLTGGRRTEAFLFTTCSLVAAHYWIPGLEKLRLGWLAHGHLHHLTIAAWANGWLAHLRAEEIGALARMLARGEVVSLGFTIAVETGALLFLLHRRVGLALLAGWTLLHVGIFATSGICFWKWALLDSGLAVLLATLPRSAHARIFGPGPLLLSLVLIAGANWWCKPVRLGWYDTRLAYTYRYTVVGPSGSAYRIAPSFFAPYDLLVSQNRFGYLSEHPTLTGTYGMTQDPAIAAALLDARTLSEVEALESRWGAHLFDAQKARTFDHFMRRFLRAWNRRAFQRPWYAPLRPPHHIWTAAREPAYAGQEPIARLLVDRVTTVWDEERVLEIRVERVRDLEIEHPASFAAGGEVAGRRGVRADGPVEEVEERGERGADRERQQADQHVARVAASGEAQPGDQRGLEVAVAALDPAGREVAQQVAQPVLGEAVVVVGRLVDLEDERRREHERASLGEDPPQLADREGRLAHVLEHLEQEDGVEAPVRKGAQVADVGHDVRSPRGVDVDAGDAGAADPRHALRELAAAPDAQHLPGAGGLLEARDLAIDHRIQVLAAEPVRGVEHELPVSQSRNEAADASARGCDHAVSPQSARIVAPGGR